MSLSRNRSALRVRVAAAMVIATGSMGALAACGDDTTATDPAASESSPADALSGGPRSAELIELAEPSEGAEVDGSFTASGKANSPEANVPWEIQDAEGEVVLDGFATADGWMDKLYPWTTEVDVSTLEPGTYLFVAMTDDPSGGEGKPAEEVSTAITVK